MAKPVKGASERLEINHTQRAYDEIRTRLITCWFVPGEQIPIQHVHTDFKLSHASVREALSKLTAEGLVSFQRNTGFRSVPIFAGGFGSLVDACNAMETVLLRRAILLGNYEWEGALLAFVHVGKRAMKHADRSEAGEFSYLKALQAVCTILFAASDNAWLFCV